MYSDNAHHLQNTRRTHEEAICVFNHSLRNRVPVRGAERQRFRQWPGRRHRPGNREKSTPKKGAGGAMLTGCLSGPNNEGAYELKSGKKEVEVGGLDDLSKHVGHKVRLHGAWAKSGSEIGEKENEASEAKEGKEEKGERHFKVASIDHLSDTCPAGAAEKAEHPKKGASAGTPPKQ
jgi:hypothetical protein